MKTGIAALLSLLTLAVVLLILLVPGSQHKTNPLCTQQAEAQFQQIWQSRVASADTANINQVFDSEMRALQHRINLCKGQ